MLSEHRSNADIGRAMGFKKKPQHQQLVCHDTPTPIYIYIYIYIYVGVCHGQLIAGVDSMQRASVAGKIVFLIYDIAHYAYY